MRASIAILGRGGLAARAALAAGAALAACGGGAAAPDAAPDGLACRLCDAPLPDAVTAQTYLTDDFATFPSAKWTSIATGAQKGTGKQATAAGNPAPALDVGDAGDTPDGTALAAAVTFPEGPGFAVTLDVRVPQGSVPAGAASRLVVTVGDAGDAHTATFTVTVQDDAANNTPFPGPAGVKLIIAGTAAAASEFQVPLDPDDKFHTIGLTLHGGLGFTWDGAGEAGGVTSVFPAGATLHLELAGSHLDPGGSAHAGAILVDNVKIATP